MDEIYQQMWRQSLPMLAQNQLKCDPFLFDQQDTRRGVTLLARVTSPARLAIQDFLQELNLLEPEQYYYPPQDLHVTVLSVLSCEKDYQLLLNEQPAYISAVQDAVCNLPAFKLEFKGISLAESALVVCGVVQDDALQRLRTALRRAIIGSGLAHSMDKRYTLMTAHSTVMRFARPLYNPQLFSQFLAQHRHRYFGLCQVSQLELVFNDWYQREANTRLLATLNLTEPESLHDLRPENKKYRTQ